MQDYLVLKNVFDAYHKAYIDQHLCRIQGDWSELANALDERQSAPDADALNKMQETYRKEISNLLSGKGTGKNQYLFPADGDGGSLLEMLDPADMIKQTVKEKKDAEKGNRPPQYLIPEFGQNIKEVEQFNRFAGYFEDYKKTRENIYASEGSTSVAHRIVHENFPKFMSNVHTFRRLPESLRQKFEHDLSELLDGASLETMFDVDYFNVVLAQAGIERYNTLLGGKKEESGVKLQGLNELCNLEFQQGNLPKKVVFVPLYKQILSDREKASFLPEKFKSVEEMLESIADYRQSLSNLMASQHCLLDENMSTGYCDAGHVYIRKSQLASLSMLCFNEWSTFRTAVEAKDVYTLSELLQAAGKDILEDVRRELNFSLDSIDEAGEALLPVLEKQTLTEDDYAIIKEYLDAVIAAQHILKVFEAEDDAEKDPVFYGVADILNDALRQGVRLYDRVRNYATGKPYAEDKFRLTFFAPTLLNGWDKNKERDNCCMLFRKDGLYYLGILNAKNKPLLDEEAEIEGASYEKMVYKYLPEPNKMLPKVFNKSQKWIAAHGLDDDIRDGYEKGLHKVGQSFDKAFMHKLIDYYKACISEYEDWATFRFRFSATDTYQTMADFYNEIAAQSYKVFFTKVSEQQINAAVEAGQLYLFQIYNKDFSPYSHGAPNLHTLYWRELFSAENLQNPLVKLNGEAEIFYRHPSIANPFRHQKGDVLINKTDAAGRTVPEDRYRAAATDAANGMPVQALRASYPELIFKVADREIVKDKRYTKESFAFHVPLTLNNDNNAGFKLNMAVCEKLQSDGEYYIMGIDRGERHLLYISVIDRNGRIVEQRSLNVVGKNRVDYQAKLDALERQRQEARKNWRAITAIKELKEGYLSMAIHEITELMLQYPCILIMEDLNFGFKRGRFRVEKQVYQKFEKMLIEKLGFWMQKDKAADAAGGIRHAYQLTESFQSFQKLGKQSGVIFYVPANYTSKIDPKTGFVNLFGSRQLTYTSVSAAKAFFGTMREIGYDAQRDCYRFAFRYSDYDLYQQDHRDSWTVFTAGKGRIAHTVKNGRHTFEEIDVTERMKELFQRFGLDPYAADLRGAIDAADKKDFFSELLWLFKVTVQLRYEDSEQDFILSPIEKDGRFFDSRQAKKDEPQDGDANGAYHIALQGLRLARERIKDGRVQKDPKGKQTLNWLRFAQRKDYLE
ncbi:MAG: type V CRISPR-associated protein Cas12a/Cpf1 [Firmicutes bacterium]|nr:type V CRISPR-associated protein Cas12a/Cpf1 [Bacillota bacterium]